MEKKIALLGMGTVGSGVLNILKENKDLLLNSTDELLTITHILVSDLNKTRTVDLSGIQVTDNIEDIKNAEIDLVVEVMGGLQDTKTHLLYFLEQGIPVVSANKDMLAEYIDELEHTALNNKTTILYEGAVAGGIPIIHSLTHSLNANRISKVMGILNGTTNFMLTQMADKGLEYEDVLKIAQDMGYAEADPSADVLGLDAARKTLLLARLAFKKRFKMSDLDVIGIDKVDKIDIVHGKKANMTLKLLGVVEDKSSSYHLSVAPIFVDNTHQLSNVKNEKNAVFVEGNAIGQAMFYGPGAGSYETASAVVSDMINTFNLSSKKTILPEEFGEVDQSKEQSDYYFRFSDSIESVKEVLKDYEYKLIDETDKVFIVKSISSKVYEDIQEELQVKASYQVIGAGQDGVAGTN
ncbi:homoserine dehydrogenase [Jeotgalicoccus meleagridis]|uniref:Homoserine dehydrogenase n=1 Tax=Jeotgalicoccus meleagridis TaxID=2759181 RepID=A0A6V7RK30_9STAP|nr:homoserine dehydrogenase [Jeotgalicoccus meleagridis]CAD2078482.1 Homoserine dehydrogenase [Jeotgalicoccus meleagridis]